MSIRRVEEAAKPGHSSYLLITDTPVELEFASLDAPDKVGVVLGSLDLHEGIEAFFRNDFKAGKHACITDIQTSWTGNHRILIAFTLKQGLAPRADSSQTRVGQQYHTLVDIYPDRFVENICVDNATSASKNTRKSEKKAEAFRLSAAVMLDYGDVVKTSGDLRDEDLGFKDNSEVRRARIVAKGRFSDWLYKVRVDLANVFDDDDDDNEAEVDRAYIGYTGWEALEIRFGLQPEPFGLEKSTSSKSITFMERSLLDTFAPEDNLGLSAISQIWDPVTVQLGAYVERPYPDGSKTDRSLSGRVFYDPVKQPRKLLHLGASYSYREPLDNQVRYRERPEAHLADNLFKTDRFRNVDWVGLSGLEAAWLKGPLSLQGEYVRSDVMQSSGEEDREVDGYYVYLSWFLTGESRPYSGGNFGRIRPRRSVGKGGWGAWEVALRYSVLEDDEDQQLADISFGLNWYLTKKTRLMLNWVHADYKSDGEEGEADIGQIRLQQLF